MYQLVAAQARSKELSADWKTVDLSTMKISDIFTTYASVWLTLSHTALSAPVYLHLQTLHTELATQFHSHTLGQWLAQLGNQSLPTTNYAPKLKLRVVEYSDAWRAGYKIEPIDRLRHDHAQVPRADKPDLLLSKAGVDFTTYHKYCMVTVNGFFHRVGGSPTGLQVVHGNRTGMIGNDNQVGIHSFLNVGALEYIPITPDMIYKTHAEQQLADFAYLKLPPQAENKIALIVIGGYLHVLDDVYKRVGPRTLRIAFNNYALPERIFESHKNIDLSSLEIEHGESNEMHLSVDSLYSDRVLTAYLCLPQSFIVLLDAKNFYLRKHPVQCSKIPNRYQVPTGTPRFPLFGALGRCYDHTVHPDWGINMLATTDNRYFNYNFRTTDWRDRTSIDDTKANFSPWMWAHAHMVEMGRFVE